MRRTLPRPARAGRFVLGRLRRWSALLVVTAGVAASGTLTLNATSAAFTATTSTAGSVTAGSVTLTDDDGGSAMLALSNLTPGDSASSCITVTYSGNLPALVKLYGTTGGTGLASYVDLRIVRGTSSGGFGNCSAFTPDATDYLGAGAGVVFDGTLASLPTTVGDAVYDPHVTAPEVWTTGEAHAYEFVATLQDDNAAQGLTATGTFTWQALNTTPYSQVVLADSPSAYWRLDETSGATAADATGAHDGTYTGGPTLNQPSTVAGTSVSFDGANDHVDVPYSPALNPASFSVEAWAKPTTSGSQWYTVVSSWTKGPEHGWWLGIHLNGHWELSAADGSSSTSIFGPAAALGTWTHLVGTYDAGTGALKLYVDGALAATTTAAYTPVASVHTLIGAEPFAPTFFTGGLDEVAVYDHVLDAATVAAHRAAAGH